MNKLLAICSALLLSSCATQNYVSQDYRLNNGETVALMPIVNLSQGALAGEQTEAILASVWQTQALPAINVYRLGNEAQRPALRLNDRLRFEQAQSWLAKQQSEFYLTGTVQEWQYKPGVERKPVVSLTLNLHRNSDDEVVWTATGARTGGPDDSLAMTAKHLLDALVDNLDN